MKNILKNNLIFYLIILSGCGGGTSSPLPIDNSNQISEPIALFNSDPITLLDAASYYSTACNNPSFQFLIPTKINEDTYTDFIAHYWCDSLTPAEYDIAPTADALVAYVSDNFGEYKIDNVNVFGEINPKPVSYTHLTLPTILRV